MPRVVGPFQKVGANPTWAHPTIKELAKETGHIANDRIWASEEDDTCLVTFDSAQKPTTLYIITKDLSPGGKMLSLDETHCPHCHNDNSQVSQLAAMGTNYDMRCPRCGGYYSTPQGWKRRRSQQPGAKQDP